MPLSDDFPEKPAGKRVVITQQGSVKTFNPHGTWFATDADGDMLGALDAWLEGYILADNSEVVLGSEHPDARPEWLSSVLGALSRSREGKSRTTAQFTVDESEIPSDAAVVIVGVSISDGTAQATGHFRYTPGNPGGEALGS